MYARRVLITIAANDDGHDCARQLIIFLRIPTTFAAKSLTFQWSFWKGRKKQDNHGEKGTPAALYWTWIKFIFNSRILMLGGRGFGGDGAVLATSLESLVQLQIIFVARDRSRNQDFLAPKKATKKQFNTLLCVSAAASQVIIIGG
jgi:hypothetical protein